MTQTLTTLFSRLGRRLTSGALLPLVSLAFGLGAQIPNSAVSRSTLADSSVPALMRLARRGQFPDEAVTDVLRQRSQAYPEAKRRELADSIANLAIHVSGAATAVGVLKRWGTVDPGLEGHPDPAALDYLIRVSRAARDAQTRMVAIRGMAFQVNPSRALSFLSDVARSANQEAFIAVYEMNRLAFGGAGNPNERAAALDSLRRLYDVGEMKSGAAITSLCEIAASQRWPAKPMCRGRA